MVGLVSIIVLGFFLGMRHATDPDHVIAVTTIVARNRGRRQAAMIGYLNAFYLMAFTALAAVPLAVLMRRVKREP